MPIFDAMFRAVSYNSSTPGYNISTTQRIRPVTSPFQGNSHTPPLRTQPPYDEGSNNTGLFSAGGGVGGFIVLCICFVLIVKFAKRYCKQEDDRDDPESCDHHSHEDPLSHDRLLQETREPAPPSPPPTYSALFSESPLEQNGSVVPPTADQQSIPSLSDIAELDEDAAEGEVSTPPPTYAYALARSMENLARRMSTENLEDDSDDVFQGSGQREDGTNNGDGESESSESSNERSGDEQADNRSENAAAGRENIDLISGPEFDSARHSNSSSSMVDAIEMQERESDTPNVDGAARSESEAEADDNDSSSRTTVTGESSDSSSDNESAGNGNIMVSDTEMTSQEDADKPTHQPAGEGDAINL